MPKKKDPRLERAGVSGYNKPKRTPNHKTKSHVVVAKEGDKVKTIRFGQKGAKTAGKPKPGESERMKAKRKSFKARHAKNIKRGKMSAAYWADKVKWQQIYLPSIRSLLMKHIGSTLSEQLCFQAGCFQEGLRVQFMQSFLFYSPKLRVRQ